MFFFLDTETTGFSARNGDRIVEIAIVDLYGNPLLNSLVNPERNIPFDAQRVHGITDNLVRKAPTLGDLWKDIDRILRGHHVVMYNAAFDRQFFPDNLGCASNISCAMLRFAKARGEINPKYGDYRWHTLEIAAGYVGHRWTGEAHRALADALACRSVWTWLEKRNL